MDEMRPRHFIRRSPHHERPLADGGGAQRRRALRTAETMRRRWRHPGRVAQPTVGAVMSAAGLTLTFGLVGRVTVRTDDGQLVWVALVSMGSMVWATLGPVDVCGHPGGMEVGVGVGAEDGGAGG